MEPKQHNDIPPQEIPDNGIPEHPIAKMVGTMGGQFWEDTLAAIREYREKDREELAQRYPESEDE